MARGLVRTLLKRPCRRGHHTWVVAGGFAAPDYFICCDCGEPGFRVPKLSS